LRAFEIEDIEQGFGQEREMVRETLGWMLYKNVNNFVSGECVPMPYSAKMLTVGASGAQRSGKLALAGQRPTAAILREAAFCERLLALGARSIVP
jgi:hypothetical protein